MNTQAVLDNVNDVKLVNVYQNKQEQVILPVADPNNYETLLYQVFHFNHEYRLEVINKLLPDWQHVNDINAVPEIKRNLPNSDKHNDKIAHVRYNIMHNFSSYLDRAYNYKLTGLTHFTTTTDSGESYYLLSGYQTEETDNGEQEPVGFFLAIARVNELSSLYAPKYYDAMIWTDLDKLDHLWETSRYGKEDPNYIASDDYLNHTESEYDQVRDLVGLTGEGYIPFIIKKMQLEPEDLK